MRFCCLWWRLQNSLDLNSDIQDSFKEFLLLFCQDEIVFVIVWFLDHFTLKPIPLMNGVSIVALVSHPHVWVTKSKVPLMFFQLIVLKLNNMIWVDFSAILFDETQHVVKTRRTTCLFAVRPSQFIFKLKGLYSIVTACDGLVTVLFHFVCKLLSNIRK